MKALKILTAAVFATFAAAALAQGFGPGSGACPAGATPGSAGCPAYGAGPGAGMRGAGMRGAGVLERLKAADTNADGMISRDEAQLAMPGLFANFDAIDANKDGLVTLQEMQAAHLAHRGHHGRGDGWKKWDADGDGKLSRSEVANAPRLAQQFDALDANKDGFLAAEELQAARAAFRGRRAPGAGWTKWDANGDGKLSREEVASAPRLSQEFDAIDADKDGFLTLEELQAAHGTFPRRGRVS